MNNIDIDHVYKKYERLVDFLDKIMDELIDLLNDLKIVNPEKEINQRNCNKYEMIFNNFDSELHKIKIEKEIFLIGDEKKLRGIELAPCITEKSGKYKFAFPKNECQIYEIVPSIKQLKFNFDAYVEVRKTVHTMRRFIRNILEYKTFLIQKVNKLSE